MEDIRHAVPSISEGSDVARRALGAVADGADRCGGFASPDSLVVRVDGLWMDRACGVNRDNAESLGDSDLTLHDRFGKSLKD